MKPQTPNIDDLSEKLSTEEGKRAATLRALEKGMPVSEHSRKSSINYLTLIRNYETALKWCRTFPEAEKVLAAYGTANEESLKVRERQYYLLESLLDLNTTCYSMIDTQTYKETIEALESAGRFDECAKVEEARENLTKERMYRALELALDSSNETSAI